MKILRLSTLSLTLAIAVFALSYNPSFADKPVDGDHNHGGGGDAGTTFSVEVMTDAANGVDTTGDLTIPGCAGTSTPSNQLSVKFLVDDRRDCGPVSINGGNFVGPVYLLEIAVQEKNKGDTVRFFFTEAANPQFAGNEFVWHSDALPALISMDSGLLEITAIGSSWTSFHLTKTHQPFKRTVSTGDGITVGKIVYTP